MCRGTDYYRMATRLGLRSFLLAGWLVTLGLPAGATTIKFYNGQTGDGGAAYNSQSGIPTGAGSVFNATIGASVNCPNAAATCGSDATIGLNSFTSLGIQITATGTGTVSVEQDLAPRFGGMGIESGQAGDDDQIGGNEVLRIHFNSLVTLTGAGTLFDNGHTPFGPGSLFQTSASVAGSNTFMLSVGDNIFTAADVRTFTCANTVGCLNLTGQDFYFTVNGSQQPEFYVSALTYNAVPGPIAGAGLPGLVMACGGLFAWARRRRQAAA